MKVSRAGCCGCNTWIFSLHLSRVSNTWRFGATVLPTCGLQEQFAVTSIFNTEPLLLPGYGKLEAPFCYSEGLCQYITTSHLILFSLVETWTSLISTFHLVH